MIVCYGILTLFYTKNTDQRSNLTTWTASIHHCLYIVNIKEIEERERVSETDKERETKTGYYIKLRTLTMEK